MADHLAANIVQYYNFDAVAPLDFDDQWHGSVGNFTYVPEDVALGFFSSTSDVGQAIASNRHYCVTEEFVLEMNARIAYNSTLVSGSVNSVLGSTEDPFYGCAYMGLVSPYEGWRFSIVLTDYKVYALYANMGVLLKGQEGGIGGDRKFAYLVPIAKRVPSDVADYTVMLKREEYDVSYRVNNVEKLLIHNVGQTIDKRFLVWSDESTTQYTPVAFPEAVQMELGVGSLNTMQIPVGAPNTVCQRTLFSMCTQNILAAPKSQCKYGTIQVGGWVSDLQAQFSNVILARLSTAAHCHDGISNSAEHWWSRKDDAGSA